MRSTSEMKGRRRGDERQQEGPYGHFRDDGRHSYPIMGAFTSSERAALWCNLLSSAQPNPGALRDEIHSFYEYLASLPILGSQLTLNGNVQSSLS